ncbi:MAG: PAC2 family protein [Nanoarchaeota archaeon]
MPWKIKKFSKLPKLKSPVFIEGLPGIGNVGKIAIDILIEETKAVKVLSFQSDQLPNTVFVNEQNLVELPKIEMYYKKIKSQDFLFMSGDVQPTTEQSSYEFCRTVLGMLEGYHCKRLITLGGIGLNQIPKQPKVFCTGNHKGFLQEFVPYKVQLNLYGIVGPIVGVSGLLLGLSDPARIQSASLLAETLGHPVYIGFKGSREILRVLNDKYKLNLNLQKLDQEIKGADEEFERIQAGLPPVQEPTKKVSKYVQKIDKIKETSYIG